MKDIKNLINQFVHELTRKIKSEIIASITGKPTFLVPNPSRLRVALPGGKTRRKGPVQLCPVPGCEERAAPVFGMVCGKHKDTPKRTIAKYRAARRAKK